MPGPQTPPLFRSFWLYLVLPRAAILLVLTGDLLVLPVVWIYMLMATDAVFFSWQVWQFQTSADDHLRGMGGMALVWGGYLAVLVAGAASGLLWWGAVLMARQPKPVELFTEQMDRLYAAEYTLDLSPDGQTLRFSGTITHGLTKRARLIMGENPQVTAVTLNSPGGHIYEARGFAGLIRDHGYDTTVQHRCSSACTLLFAAGHGRAMAPDARLGFHSYALEFGPVLPNLDLQKEQEKDRAFFRQRGISDAFLIQIFDEPSSGLWFPSIDALKQAGFLTAGDDG